MPYDPATPVFRGAHRDKCIRKIHARRSTAALTGFCVHFFQKVPGDIEILMQSATVDFALCTGPRLGKCLESVQPLGCKPRILGVLAPPFYRKLPVGKPIGAFLSGSMAKAVYIVINLRLSWVAPYIYFVLKTTTSERFWYSETPNIERFIPDIERFWVSETLTSSGFQYKVNIWGDSAQSQVYHYIYSFCHTATQKRSYWFSYGQFSVKRRCKNPNNAGFKPERLICYEIQKSSRYWY